MRKIRSAAFVSLSLGLVACGGSDNTQLDQSAADEIIVEDDTSTEPVTDEGIVIDVDATLFLTGENVSVNTVSCTLVDGSDTLCYEIT